MELVDIRMDLNKSDIMTVTAGSPVVRWVPDPYPEGATVRVVATADDGVCATLSIQNIGQPLSYQVSSVPFHCKRYW